MAAQRKRPGAKRAAATSSAASKSSRSRGRARGKRSGSPIRALIESFPPLLTAVVVGLALALLLVGYHAPAVKSFALSEADKVIGELRILAKTLHDLKESVLSRQGAEPSKPVEHRRPIIEKNLTS